MYKSLFSRLLITYSIILVCMVLVMGVLFYAFLQDYIINDIYDELEREGRSLNPVITSYLGGMLDSEFFGFECKLVDRYENTTIWIYDINDTKGQVAYSSAPDYTYWEELEPLTDSDLSVLSAGKTIKTSNAYRDKFNSPVISVGVPLRLRDESKTIYGAVFLHTPMKIATDLLVGVFENILKGALISVAFASLLIYFISHRVSQPLKQMSHITREIAKGNFQSRIEEQGKDETYQLAQNFNAMADKLEQTDQVRKEFVANVSHELRSPLTSIQGYIQGVVDDTFDEQNKTKYLTIALDETKRLGRMINELLELTRMESDRNEIQLSVFNINESLRRAIAAMEEKISAKKLNLSVDFEKEPTYVLADKDKIQQVVVNLIDNAIKFNGENGELAIKTWTHKDITYIKIKDSGIGMNDEDIMRIWERFYQSDPSRRLQGTGLGLAIVKKILDDHHQKIWVNSVLEEGSEFIFSLENKKSAS